MKTQRNYLHVLWRVPALILWLTVMPILFFVVRALGLAWYQELPHYFHRGVQWILGLRVTKSGVESCQSPTLFVSNHISYIDIFALGEIRAYFIAKSEVANWPVLGPLSRFQNTLFIERSAGKAKEQIKTLQDHLAKGQSLILFPEGTSTDGAHVEPFKSSLFESARLADQQPRVAIQPLTIVYTHHAGLKMDQSLRDNYAWYAKMPFTPHFFNLFTLKKVDVKVHFHPVTYIDEFESRKACADHCCEQVSSKMAEFLAAA